MIIIDDKRKCSGCMACKNACASGAITMKYDSEGFWYPEVNKDLCSNCGQCEIVCPFHDSNHGVPGKNASFRTEYYAAQLIDKRILSEVSSGGAFQAIATAVLDEGGIVYGVAQEDVDHIFHIRASSIEELKQTRRSKYFQSDINDTFRRAQKDLQRGKIVLFSGTGCQIAGLNCFLRKSYDKLITCEVVCHGVPSRFVWECYRKEKEKIVGKRIVDLVFRDKSKGWNNNQYKITYEDGSTEFERSTVHLFHAGYLQGYFYRPSCGECVFASMPRVADVTLADFWSYHGLIKTKNLGVSLIAINNSNGEVVLEKARKYLHLEQTTRESALGSCRHMDEFPVENPQREIFIRETLKYGYFTTAQEYIKHDDSHLKQIILKLVRRILRS